MKTYLINAKLYVISFEDGIFIQMVQQDVQCTVGCTTDTHTETHDDTLTHHCN